MLNETRKVVLVTRKTRLEALVAQYHTLAQAKFYVEHLGADFSDYLRENEAYASSLRIVVESLQTWGRYQILDRAHLTNFLFAPTDIVLALGQDGLVANTLKYLDGQPLIGVNPEPKRWDGVLLPFEPAALPEVLSAVARDGRPTQSVTLAEARLSDGQVLRGVNDLFIGPRTHTSALYEIVYRDRSEQQSSSGLIVSTGLGSTAWLKSVVTGSMGVAKALGTKDTGAYRSMPWDTDRLVFAVREPFESRSSQTSLIYGEIKSSEQLVLRSRMPENGVIFSDGMEADFLRFTAGMEAQIGVSKTRGVLVR
jgi:NAD kinase